MEVITTIHPMDQEHVLKREYVDNQIIPLLEMITKKTQATMDHIERQLKFSGQTSKSLHRLRLKFDQEILSWTQKIKRLGGIPVTIGQVKFLCQDKIYYWQYGLQKVSATL